ncbi:MAG TPA: sialidase family protein, partial [Longimicrobium sp.]|nr:sialidase family protein [Longimicrobium sp.]
GGRTWSALRKTRVWGIPPHLLTLSDGRVLLSRGYRRDRRGVRYSLSYDGGRTWDPGIEGVLEGGADNVDCGYPSTVELDDGSLWTVYYTSDRPGGGELVATVRAVHYRIPPRVQPGS